MLRSMYGKTRHNRIGIGNDNIGERVGVAPFAEKMVETHLRWFQHVETRL
jgi:hypothetical protein